MVPLRLRSDFDAQSLRSAARRAKDGPQARRLLALADRRSVPGASRGVRVSVSPQTLSREVRAMGYRKLSGRPRHHAQAEGAIEDFKRASPSVWRTSRRTWASIRPT